MKAHKAKMKKINARKPKNWKIASATALINSLYGTLGKRTVFGNLWGGGPRGRPPQEEMLFNMDHARGGPPCKEQILMCHKKKRYQTWTTARLKDAPPEGSKGHKEPKDTPPEGPKCQN